MLLESRKGGDSMGRFTHKAFPMIASAHVLQDAARLSPGGKGQVMFYLGENGQVKQFRLLSFLAP
jgi:hypothetical protein